MGIASAGKACLAVRQLSGTGIFLKKGLTRRGLLRIIIKHSFEGAAELCNGSTCDSDSHCEGSNPSSATISKKSIAAKESTFLFYTISSKDLLIKVKWKFQNIEFEKKGIRNQAAEQFKIERAAGQGGIWYRFRPVSVCLDKQLPRRNKYAGTC